MLLNDPWQLPVRSCESSDLLELSMHNAIKEIVDLLKFTTGIIIKTETEHMQVLFSLVSKTSLNLHPELAAEM